MMNVSRHEALVTRCLRGNCHGFLFVSARGDEKKLETAKAGIQWSLIGAALIEGASFLAEAVVNFVKEF